MLSGEEIQCSPRGCGSLGGVVGPIKRPNRARIGNWYTGWYLFALDAHLANNTSGLVGYSSPAAIPPSPTNATVIRSEPYGPVTGPPAPRVRLLPDAQVHGNQVAVASVRCAVSCHLPSLDALARALGSVIAADPAERFAYGLELIIDGIRERLPSR